MLDDLILDAALQSHQEVARNRAVCDVCHTRCAFTSSVCFNPILFQGDVFMFMFVFSLRFRRCGLGERCLQDTPGPMMSGNGDVIDHLPTCLCST